MYMYLHCCTICPYSASIWQDMSEFCQLRNDYSALEARYAESESRLTDAQRLRDAKV